ncbi:MAG: PilZ domain-containing protein [Deltaproteobacteria bacterium]|nr:PilZ domain-containing protein [Deltaproteobacteria bacterium]
MRRLEKGQRIALRVATGVEERQYPCVVRSFDRARGLISLEVEDGAGAEAVLVSGREATIVGRTAYSDLDLPCVLTGEGRFPILVCRGVDRRDHLRVSAFLRLKYRPVERAVYEADPDGVLLRIQEEMGTSESPSEGLVVDMDGDLLNPRLASFLEEMDRKLDRILSLLDREKEALFRQATTVNISGSGLRFVNQERIDAKTLLAMRLLLPFTPPVAVVFLGEVKRVRAKGQGEFETAVKFVAIDEADQEKIVHYAFKRMRESIRNQKKRGMEE